MASHVLNMSVNNNGLVVGGEQTYTGGGEANLEEAIPQDSTDLELLYSLDVSQIQSIIITADQAMTLETNDGTTPADTITLVANKPYVWHLASYYTNLLTTDITSIFVTNTTPGTLKIQCVFDPTA